jgi:hypothetical protein
MDTTLVTVTLLSMGMAGALSVIVWRLLRDERQRSDARVAALTTLAASPERAPRVEPAGPERAERVERARVERARPQVAVHPPVHRDRTALDLDLPIRPAPPMSRVVAETEMFVDRPNESPWRTRLVVIAALGLVIASVVLFSLAASARAAARARALHSAPAAAAQNRPASAPTPAGLELTSLRDSRRAGELTITGLVRNPQGAAVLTRVSVTAYAFDDKGAFLGSGRALIDVTSLGPGDESPFEVSVPVAETVARYRIGFRTEDGRVITHVDKRQQGPMAALRLGSGQANW